MNINAHKYFSPDNFWVKMLFLISGLSITTLLSISLRSSIAYSIGLLIPSIILALVIWTWLIFQYNILEKLWADTSKWIKVVAVVFSCVTSWLFGSTLCNSVIGIIQRLDTSICYIIENIQLFCNIPNVIRIVEIVERLYPHYMIFLVIFFVGWGLIMIPCLYIIWKNIISVSLSKIHDYYLSMDKIEKWYLFITLSISIILIPIIYSLTNVFYYPTTVSGTVNGFAGIFGADTGNLLETNAFGNINAPENDVRQMLFGLFALPFSVLSYIISKIFFFIPHMYPIGLGILQALCSIVIALLISHLLNIEDGIKKILFLVLFTISYPTLLFSLVLEQYVFATFWLILFIYIASTSGKFKEIAYIGACGTLSTSVITMPLLSRKIDIRKYLSVGVLAFVIMILSGQLWKIVASISSVISLSSFTGSKIGIPFIERLLQYLNFVSLTAYTPSTSVINAGDIIKYSQNPELSLNIFGLLIILLVVIGFLLNHKNIFANICFGMVIFSAIILCIIGWNTGENCLALQSFYFGWAFISLIFLAIDKIFDKYSKIKILTLSCLILTMLYINLIGICDVIAFGIEYYPGVLLR